MLGALALTTFSSRAFADNPIVQHVYTADPAPMVHEDRVYLCTSHDEDVTRDGFFTMDDWRVFSSKDMVNWTDHGSPLSYHSFSWATGKAWAPHCIARNGKFYMYVPVSDSIGVAVADSPTGPFEDAIGRPLVSNYQYIDPSVFIDKDGQAYLYFGNPRLWYVKLNEDMISFSGQVQQVDQTTAGFGQRNGDAERPTLYEEGPWFYFRDSRYYMMFAAGPLPEDIAYATSAGPTGPWTFGKIIMDSTSGHAFTNHAGVVDFKGHSYFFYHTQELPGGGGYKRSVALEEFEYNSDGSFPTISKTQKGPDALENLNPFERVEGETIAWTGGVEIEDSGEGGRAVAQIENNDYIKVKAVDFRTGATTFEATVASAGSGGSIELHLDSQSGALLGTCAVEPTGGWQTWETVSCEVEVSVATDVHDLFLVFKGGSGSLFNLDFWQFTPKDPISSGTGGAPGTGGDSAIGGASATGGASSSLGGGIAEAGGAGSSGGGAGAGGASGSAGGAVGQGGSGGAMSGSGGLSSSGGTPSGSGGDESAAGDNGAGCSCSSAGSNGSAPATWIPIAGLWLWTRTRRRRIARSLNC